MHNRAGRSCEHANKRYLVSPSIQGFATGACHYAVEYATLIPDWREATHLAKLCFGTDG